MSTTNSGTNSSPEKRTAVSRLLRTSTYSESSLGSRKESFGKRPLSAIFLPKKLSTSSSGHTALENRSPITTESPLEITEEGGAVNGNDQEKTDAGRLSTKSNKVK